MAGLPEQQPAVTDEGMGNHRLQFPWLSPPSKPSVNDVFYDALRRSDADGMLAILTSPEGEAVTRGAAQFVNGAVDVACLRFLRKYGFKLYSWTWEKAAIEGRTDSLEFAVSRGYKLKDSVLEAAVYSGQLACVEFLLQQGLPRKPFAYCLSRARAHQLKCIQLMFDRKVAFDPQTLIKAASWGEVDYVRCLH